MWWWILACVRVTEPPGLTVEQGLAGGTARVTLDGWPPGLAVRIDAEDDHRLRFTHAPTETFDLLGLLPDRTYTISVGSVTASVAVGSPDPAVCPTLDVLAHDPARAGDAWTFLAHNTLYRPGSCVLVLDEALRPRWWWVSPDASFEDAVRGPDGTVWLRGGGVIEVLTWFGDPLARYSPSPDGDERALPLGGAEHEVFPLADGSFWTFGSAARPFEVPVAIGAAETAVATIETTPAQHVAADGTLLGSIDPADALEPGRSGFDALREWPLGLDFVHGNAIVPLPDGRVLLSLRNQDVNVMYGEDGEVQWRFGDPAGWSSPWAETFLAPEGEPSWPYHSHGTDFDPATGRLMVFDNHTEGGNPYTPAPGGDDSRVAVYQVDEGARTVRFVAAYAETATGPLRSSIMGDADLPDVPDGPIRSVYTWVGQEDGVLNTDRGWGAVTSRIVTFDPAAPDRPALDVRLRLDGAAWPDGGYVYRVQSVPRMDR